MVLKLIHHIICQEMCIGCTIEELEPTIYNPLTNPNDIQKLKHVESQVLFLLFHRLAQSNMRRHACHPHRALKILGIPLHSLQETASFAVCLKSGTQQRPFFCLVPPIKNRTQNSGTQQTHTLPCAQTRYTRQKTCT